MDLSSLLTTLAILLLCALAGGRLAAFLHAPRVTGYLLAGLLVGPSLAELLSLPVLLDSVALAELDFVREIGLALILMNIGSQFRGEYLRRWKGRILLFSFTETSCTWLLVALATALTNLFWLHRTLGNWSLVETSLVLGLLFGTIAMTTAPAATMMVVREYESEGPVTATLMTLIGLNGLLTIVGFTLLSHLFFGREEVSLLMQLGAPVLIGLAFGLSLSIWGQRLDLPSEQKLLVMGGVIAAAGLSRTLGVNPLLACFVLGTTLANSSPRWHLLFESLRQIDYPVYVAFFILAGARLHLETLAHIGALGVAYVLARSAGKFFGARLGARLGSFGDRERDALRFCLFAQGGVAIGLSTALTSSWPEGGKLVETVILGSVVVFELVGPLAVRFGLVRAGEVPLLSLLQKRAPQGTLEGLHSVVRHFRNALGLPAGHRVRDPGDILVKHVMRENVETILDSTPYNELLRLIAHSRYDRFPVVNDAGRFIGMINYTEIRNLLFEPSLAKLVVASDLTAFASHALYPDQPLREALKTLQQHRHISFFPVIDPDQPDRLLGILSQNDVLAAFRRLGG